MRNSLTMRHSLIPLMIGLALLFTACQIPAAPGTSASQAATETSTPEAAAAETPTAEATPAAAPTEIEAGPAAMIDVRSQEALGQFLVDGEGMSLYLFEADEDAEGSTCTGDCADVWPPLLTTGEPTAAAVVDASLLGTIERKDGSTQVTYNGWPLYRYSPDEQPGDIKGQGLEQFGAEWYLVTPKGSALESEESEEGGAEATPTTEASTTTEGETTANPVKVELVSFEIRLPEQLPAGPTEFEVTNVGDIAHNFEIEGQGIEQVFPENLQPGETKTLQVDLKPGEYDVYCPVDSHAEKGMRLTLTISGQ